MLVRKFILPVGAVALIAVSGIMQAQDAVPADARTYTLTPRFEKGTVYRYQTQQSLDMKFKTGETTVGFSSGIDATLRYKVRDVKGDGVATLTALYDGGKLMDVSNDVKIQPKEPDDYPRTATLDRLGKLLSLRDTGKSGRKDGQLNDLFGDTNMLVPLHFLPMPERGVKVGGTWTATLPLLNAKEDKKNTEKADSAAAEDKNAMRATLTLLGTDKIGNQETLKVKHVLTVPFEAGTDAEGKPVADTKRAAGKVTAQLIYTQVAHVMPETGQVLRAEGQIVGEVKFEGALIKLVPSDTMKITGELITVHLTDAAAPKN